MMFLAELKKTFAHPVSEGSAMKWLLNLYQDFGSCDRLARICTKESVSTDIRQ